MPKKILTDIKPISHRSSDSASQNSFSRKESKEPLPREIQFEPAPVKSTSKHTMWYLAALCVVGLLFALSYLFESASVTITPKSITASFDSSDTLTAYKDSNDPDQISFTVMSLDGDESIKLPATQTNTTDSPARGTVTIYNAYTNTAYKLAKNTRLEANNGQIYRIDSAVTVPGYKKIGNMAVSGTVDATVTAAISGDVGNMVNDNSELKMPGFTGKPQYTKIIARPKTDFTGGAAGGVYTIPQASADAALGTLKDKLKKSLISKAKVQVPNGYLFFEGATLFTTGGSVKAPASKEKEIPIALHGTLTAYLIKQDNLVKTIAQKVISQYNNEDVIIPKLESLTLIPDPKSNISTTGDDTFDFAFSGDSQIVWVVNPDVVKGGLVGRKRADFDSILSSIPGVDQAEVVIKPFWKQSFPDNISKINISILSPK